MRFPESEVSSNPKKKKEKKKKKKKITIKQSSRIKEFEI